MEQGAERSDWSDRRSQWQPQGKENMGKTWGIVHFSLRHSWKLYHWYSREQHPTVQVNAFENPVQK